MPLNRDTVTAAELITLPLYMTVCGAYGLTYLFDPLDNLNSVHALAYQRSVLPMPVWGVLFLVIGAIIGVARFVYHHRLTTAFALSMCAVTWLIWGALYVVSMVMDPTISAVAPVLPWFVSGGCIASIAMLVKRGL